MAEKRHQRMTGNPQPSPSLKEMMLPGQTIPGIEQMIAKLRRGSH
jgi:hypothetical protein